MDRARRGGVGVGNAAQADSRRSGGGAYVLHHYPPSPRSSVRPWVEPDVCMPDLGSSPDIYAREHGIHQDRRREGGQEGRGDCARRDGGGEHCSAPRAPPCIPERARDELDEEGATLYTASRAECKRASSRPVSAKAEFAQGERVGPVRVRAPRRGGARAAQRNARPCVLCFRGAAKVTRELQTYPGWVMVVPQPCLALPPPPRIHDPPSRLPQVRRRADRGHGFAQTCLTIVDACQYRAGDKCELGSL